MNFSEFFSLYLERQSYATRSLNSDIIATRVLDKIRSGELNFSKESNTYLLKLKDEVLKIVLKPINRYRKEGWKESAAHFIANPLPTIELFIFDLLSVASTQNTKTNNTKLLQMTQQNRDIITLKSKIAHELSHAFEYFYNYLSFTSKNNSNDIDSKYYNNQSELNARVIEWISPVNSKWKKEFQQGTWYNINRNINLGILTSQLISNSSATKFFTPENKKRQIKLVYTTLQKLWEYYYKKSHEVI